MLAYGKIFTTYLWVSIIFKPLEKHSEIYK